ncbi:hypothetical protein Ahy_A09g042801 [Arachis hypogaea]|uniref:Reverse transcriptase zinc-binding domain-containing protein n=1 Tax=Arachis hypogaea TaxID=3818 RepID=A0A445BGS7_ARAHY|nr:hypothetical protein Ahy_A09g042801 [Arachis hypogaea]
MGLKLKAKDKPRSLNKNTIDTKKRENNKGGNWLQSENSDLFKGNKGLSSESDRTLMTITDEASAENLPDSATHLDCARKFKKLKQMARVGDGGLQQIQTKLQIFLWRAIHERLPVLHVIHHRFENTLPLCLRCRVEDETITHCLHCCGPAVATWNALFPAETVARNGSPDFATWWMRVITKNQGTETLVRIAIICWELWKARNREVFEGKKMTVEEIIEVVARYR